MPKLRTIASFVDAADDLTTLSTGRAIVYSITVTTVLSAHALRFENSAGTAFAVLPASAEVGSQLAWAGLEVDGLVVDPDNAATGEVVVEWAPQHN
jgi:hypothetical protein